MGFSARHDLLTSVLLSSSDPGASALGRSRRTVKLALESGAVSRTLLITLLALGGLLFALFTGPLRTTDAPHAPSPTGGAPLEGAVEAPHGPDALTQTSRQEPASSAERPSLGSAADGGAEVEPSLVGRVQLLDGSPLAGVRVLAIDAAEPFLPVNGPRHGPVSVPGVLADTVTDDQGELRCTPEQVAKLVSRPFRLRHLGEVAIPQVDTVYDPAMVGSLVHRLPAGILTVHAVDVQSQPVSRAMVRVEGVTGGPLFDFTSAEGSAVFYLSRSCTFGVHAFHPDRRIGAVVEERVFVPQNGADVGLELLPMDRGMVRVEVTDQNGMPVDRFAIRFLDHEQFVRHATESDLWHGQYVAGLPEVPLDAHLDIHYAGSPSMYARSEKARRQVTPDAQGTQTLRFTLNLQSRVAFDVDGWDARTRGLQVRIRRSEAGTLSDWKKIGVWKYMKDGAMSAVDIMGAGRWYTELLEPGVLGVEVTKEGCAEPVFSQWMELAAGECATRRLRLEAAK